LLNGAHACERRVAEVAELLHALAERVLESWSVGQVVTQTEQLQRRRVAVVEHQQAIAEPV
jgi:hypothetical protein